MAAYTKNSPGAPVGAYTKGDTVTDSAGTAWVCTVTGNPAQFDTSSADLTARVDTLEDQLSEVPVEDYASGLITVLDGGTETDTLTIDEQVFTLDDTPTGDNALATAATPELLTAALLAKIQAHPDYAEFSFTVSLEDAVTLRVYAAEAGAAGNELGLSETGATFEATGAGFFTFGVNSLETRVQALEAAMADFEARITVLEGA